jgi:hypothetical protein
MTIQEQIAQFTAEIERLATRLQNGVDYIEAEQAKGNDVAQLEAGWIKLLTKYERTCDRRSALELELGQAS